MKFSFDQHAPQSAPASRTGSRQARQSGGSPISSRGRIQADGRQAVSGRRPAAIKRRSRANRPAPPWALAAAPPRVLEVAPSRARVVNAIGSRYCRVEVSSISMSGPLLFDRQLLRARRRRALAFGPATFLLERAADDLAERLGAVLRRFDLAVDLGTPTDAVRRALAAGGVIRTMIAADPLAPCLTDETALR